MQRLQQIFRIPSQFFRMNTLPTAQIRTVITDNNLGTKEKVTITTLSVDAERLLKKGVAVNDFLSEKVNRTHQVKDCPTLSLILNEGIARFYKCDESGQITKTLAVAYISF